MERASGEEEEASLQVRSCYSYNQITSTAMATATVTAIWLYGAMGLQGYRARSLKGDRATVTVTVYCTNIIQLWFGD